MSDNVNERLAVLETESKLMNDYFKSEGIRLHRLLERQITASEKRTETVQTQIDTLTKTVNKIVIAATIIGAVIAASQIGLIETITTILGGL